MEKIFVIFKKNHLKIIKKTIKAKIAFIFFCFVVIYLKVGKMSYQKGVENDKSQKFVFALHS